MDDDDLLQYVEEIPQSKYIKYIKPQPKGTRPPDTQPSETEVIVSLVVLVTFVLVGVGWLIHTGFVMKYWESATTWLTTYQVEREAERRLEQAERELEIQQAVERLRSNQ